MRSEGGSKMPASGWKQLLQGAPWFQGEGKYPIVAYSEYIPPPTAERGHQPGTEKGAGRWNAAADQGGILVDLNAGVR